MNETRLGIVSLARLSSLLAYSIVNCCGIDISTSCEIMLFLKTIIITIRIQHHVI